MSVIALELVEKLSVALLGGFIILVFGYINWKTSVKIAFVLVLFEGALRKWALPQARDLIYFAKDAFLIGPYIRYFIDPDHEMRSKKLNLSTFGFFILAGIVAVQAFNPNFGSLMTGLFGLKIYMFYLPLLFIIPYLYKSESECLTELTYFAMLALPIGMLGILQWHSGADSIWNTYAADMSVDLANSGPTGFGVGIVGDGNDHARITGTFSYITGHATFCIFFTALHLILLTIEHTKYKVILACVNLPLLVGNGLMNGSRAVSLSIIFVFGCFILCQVVGLIKIHAKSLAYVYVAVVLMITGALAYFTKALLLQLGRYNGQSITESIHERTIGWAIASFGRMSDEAGILGYGMGSTHPATVALVEKFGLAKNTLMTPVADQELPQVYVELGPLCFFAWYIIRLIILGWLIRVFINTPSDLLKKISLACILIYLPHFFLSLVLNHTAGILMFGFIGLSYSHYIVNKNFRSA